MARRFAHYVAIDWSGARGERHKGIAVAIARANGGPPVLLERHRGWTREEALDLLRAGLPDNSLVGMDLGMSLPFADRGAYFPGWERSPPDAPALWKLVDAICAPDAHLGAGSFVDHPRASPFFRRHGGREGALFGGGRGRFRLTEMHQEMAGCRPCSNFNLVGAAQVGKSSLTGMRVLHQLGGALPVWPFDPLPPKGSVIVEIYTALAAIAAGRTASTSKVRCGTDLDVALSNLESEPAGLQGPLDDHSADALLTAAWLRDKAYRTELWAPAAMTEEIAATEGWTFGTA